MINNVDIKLANLTLSLDVLYHILEDDFFITNIPQFNSLFLYSGFSEFKPDM